MAPSAPSALAQRRSQQNTVDPAALAAANDLIVNQGSANWVATARSVAKKNGFEHGVSGATVDGCGLGRFVAPQTAAFETLGPITQVSASGTPCSGVSKPRGA